MTNAERFGTMLDFSNNDAKLREELMEGYEESILRWMSLPGKDLVVIFKDLSCGIFVIGENNKSNYFPGDVENIIELLERAYQS